MPDRSRGVRRISLALGLSLLLLADLPVAWSGGAASAADGAKQGSNPPATPTAPVSVAPGASAMPSASADPAVPDVSSTPPHSVQCNSGFGDIDSKVALALHGVTLTGRGALAVGFSRAGEDDDFGQRRPASLWNVADRWTRVPTSSPGAEDGLVAVTAAEGGSAWAVGFTTIAGQTMPLAMRWNGRDWTVDRPAPGSGLTSLFTDVAMVGTNPFGVGYRMTPDGGTEPVAARRDRLRWQYVSPKTGRRESVSLTGVADDLRGGLWVVGHGGPGTEIGPVIYRRDNARWRRVKAPGLRGEAVLADVVASAPREAWAVGYQQVDGRTLPLVLRWDGGRWSRAVAPDFGSPEVILTAVTASPTGGIWVVGSAWDVARDDREAVAAWWDGRAWNEVAGPEGGTELHDAFGSLDRDGWAVGRAGLQSSAARVCLPARSGIFGSSEPTPEPAAARAVVTQGAATGVLPAASPTASSSSANTAALATHRGGGGRRKDKAGKHRKGGQRALKERGRRPRRQGPQGLPPAQMDPRIVARDVAVEAGIAELTTTYGAVVADFDGDGVDDLFIGRHGRPGRLVLARGGRFVDHPAMAFPGIDRHGCTAADVDGSGLPDLYCTVGGKRGSGLKSNELWLDPGGPRPISSAVESGVSDPTGRGRRAVFLEAQDSPRIDLVVTNSPVRVDGLPSLGQLLRTEGDGRFAARARAGFAARLGSLAIQDADYDADGREDLLLVTGGPQAPRRQGTRLYRSTPRGLVDVTRQTGIRPLGEIDAELVDLDRDDRLDLVQLSPTRLRVSQWRHGRFRRVYERRLTEGRAVSGGDVNGDGKDDLYIVRANGDRNIPDVLLVNRDAGAAWTSLVIPQAWTGRGDDAVVIDHDGNGREDFVVLNGNNARGPVQLIAFFEPPAPSET